MCTSDVSYLSYVVIIFVVSYICILFLSFFYFLLLFLFLFFYFLFFFFFSSRRRHTRSLCDWSSDVCSSDLDLRRWTEITHLEANPCAGDGWLNFAHPDDRERLRTEWSACVLGKGELFAAVRLASTGRSEERRVGKECRSGWATYYSKKKERE